VTDFEVEAGCDGYQGSGCRLFDELTDFEVDAGCDGFRG
jgi:hypothetical protein